MYNSPTTFCAGVQLEKAQLLYDEWFLAQMYGDTVIFYLNQESTVHRDSYNSIKTKDKALPRILTARAYPIIFSPTKYQMEKAGIQEQVTAIITVAMKYWIDAGYDDTDLNSIKAEVSLRGQTYTISDKSLQKQIADTFAVINIGLFRK